MLENIKEKEKPLFVLMLLLFIQSNLKNNLIDQKQILSNFLFEKIIVRQIGFESRFYCLFHKVKLIYLKYKDECQKRI